MPRRTYPVKWRIELSGPAQGCEWKGEVSAHSRDKALIIAGARAAQDGVIVTDETWFTIERID